ncbi:type II secretion system F family protein [Naasia aerilata]|uniref:Type II secretion system protein F n=1 Tax=Naasia aerilata TaxID=1162966 RepID=A0ABM8G849_9MICO|nr:type II secretion system F family protein [Naasia aerilata]BDZ44364.1 type II secretion system protein F [Naasia aerilata]
MRLLLCAAFGAGLLLLASPWIWPGGFSRRPSGRGSRLREALAQAGLDGIPLRALLALSLLAALASGGLVLAFTSATALGIAAGLLGLALPALLVGSRARRARRAARAAWPDLLDHLVASLRSGVPLTEALAGLAAVAPPSFRAPFAAFGAAYASTGNLGLCLDELKQRLADPVADRLLETVRMAREVGGTELPGVLRALGASLRQEAAVRGEIEARQSWTRGAARLGLAAPWVVFALLSTRPEAAAAYGTPSGIALLLGGLVVSLVAYRLMLAAGRLPPERRWFR